MRINQNVAAFNAFRNLNNTQVQLQGSLEKLSSGFRINRAADDAAGLVKSESLRAEIRGTQQAIRNAQDGVSWTQTTEGVMDEIHGILQRMRELAVDAANTATTGGEEQQAELEELADELDALQARTSFAGQQVFQDYSGEDDELVFFATAGVLGGLDDQKLEIDNDLSIEVSDGGTTGVQLNIFGDDQDDVDLTEDAEGAIAQVDSLIDTVSSVRGELGAVQNRLESTVRNLSVAVENLSAAESRIRDVDMAEEVVELTRHQILQQAGTAMLAQANQVPTSVLGLLQ